MRTSASIPLRATLIGVGTVLILVCDNDVTWAQPAAPPLPPAAATAPPARDPVAGEALFREGRRLLKAGDLANACKTLAESERLDPAPGTLANLAECEEQLGQTASAWQHWLRFADEVPPEDPRRTTALHRVAELEKRLARLAIEPLADAPAALQVFRDGVSLGAASYGVALPLDPGPHTVVVQAPGRTPRRFELVIAPGEQRRLEVTAGPPVAPPPVVLTPAAPAATTNPGRATGLVLLGTGAVALGAGAYLGLRALAARRQARDHCAATEGGNAGTYCWDRAYGALSRDATYSRLADVALVAGALATATGVYFVLRKGEPRRETVGLALGFAPGAAGGEVHLGGRF